MKVCLIGADGMLGHAIQKVFSDMEVTGFTIDLLDITNLDDTVKKIKDARPDFLIHTAAFTNVDLCESEPEKAYLVNGLGTRNVAMACEEINCPLLYISTDYVFDGTKGSPYNEWDEPKPVSVYGLSKLMGERFVSALTNRFYIVRTSWLYGPDGKNFVDTIVRLLSEKESLQVVNDQYGAPTFTMDLARKIRELLGRGYGTYHITNSGSCTWFDFAVAIAAKRGIKKTISPITSEEFNRPAKRPPYSVLANTLLKLEGIREARHWEEALQDYLSK
jgi:dTDP-4-dehydrorhamnose reductase